MHIDSLKLVNWCLYTHTSATKQGPSCSRDL